MQCKQEFLSSASECKSTYLHCLFVKEHFLLTISSKFDTMRKCPIASQASRRARTSPVDGCHVFLCHMVEVFSHALPHQHLARAHQYPHSICRQTSFPLRGSLPCKQGLGTRAWRSHSKTRTGLWPSPAPSTIGKGTQSFNLYTFLRDLLPNELTGCFAHIKGNQVMEQPHSQPRLRATSHAIVLPSTPRTNFRSWKGIWASIRTRLQHCKRLKPKPKPKGRKRLVLRRT